MQSKPHINIAVIGHINAGKSTTTGHLLYKCGEIDKSALEKARQEAIHLNKDTYSFAFLLDKLKTERERGTTINVSYSSFSTLKFHFSIIDVPGHRNFLKNMIRGTTQADAALLIIAGGAGEFEVGVSSEGQTNEHILLAYTLGVKQMIVCINKMDEDSVSWSETRYNKIKKEVSEYLKKVGYNPDKISFIPISGWTGENLVEKCDSKDGSWYEGCTLIQALDNLIPPKRLSDKPLRIPICDVYKIGGYGTVIAGKIESGTIRPYTCLKFGLTGIAAECRTIKTHIKHLPEAQAGQIVGVHVKAIGMRDVKIGDLCGEGKRDPPMACKEFTAQIVIINHANGVRNGYTPVLNCHTSHVPCRFDKILAKVDRKTNKIIEENPEVLCNGDYGIVKMIPIKGLCIENFSEYPALGRFVMRDMKKVVAVGIVKTVIKICK